MRIEHDFEYDASCEELADEFCAHDSEYQAKALNAIGTMCRIWTQDKTKTFAYIQILEIAEQLNDNGKWFVKTLYEYMTEAKNADSY